ncbi:tetratricopeptide repeat protein [Snodgrassella gandavensis]|uniref:tetratricopeptide repeat protein n=1 Tax=Snodgrassella gandavensis TaxID=2946698 RepID=UPI001EF675E9|nr:hypothetical protein [Snodgrassella gandavensis]
MKRFNFIDKKETGSRNSKNYILNIFLYDLFGKKCFVLINRYYIIIMFLIKKFFRIKYKDNPEKILLMTLLIMLSTSVFADGCAFLEREENYVKAFPFCKQEAEQGDARAQYELGKMYFESRGVEKNNLLAKKYFKQACDKGSKDGCDNYKKI